MVHDKASLGIDHTEKPTFAKIAERPIATALPRDPDVRSPI
jgi:hypothetical protein